MCATTPKNEYSFTLVDSILSQYLDISEGVAELSTEAQNTHSMGKMPLETQLIMKADIDMVLEGLGKPGIWLRQSKEMTKPLKNLTQAQYKVWYYIHYPDTVSCPESTIKEIVHRLNGN